jgi:HTH-type transcriptional regulator / antitoxin HigA
MNLASAFQPDWISPPGETIADILRRKRMPLTDFAKKVELQDDAAKALIGGSIAIDENLAARLEAALGPSAAFWMAREVQFRSDSERLPLDVRQERREWLKKFPLADMKEFGWLPSSRYLDQDAQARACLTFFGVNSVGAWQLKYERAMRVLAFRTSGAFESKPGSVAAWLRQGEIAADSISTKRWNSDKFKKVLSEIRVLTRKKEPSRFLPELKAMCAECGVAVAIVRAPAGCRASGATRFVSKEKALLLLSFRYRSDDHFWFTFFHEAAHLLLHGNKAVFFEGQGMLSTHEEEEANKFAEETLVPEAVRQEMLALPNDFRAVMRFAKRIGISPGIVVGQLQHHGKISRKLMNYLKVGYVWA